MQVSDITGTKQLIDVGVAIDDENDSIGSSVEDRLHLLGIVDAGWSRQWLVADDQHRTRVALELLLQPLHLLRADVRRIATLVIGRSFVAIEDDQAKALHIPGVVTTLHLPLLEQLIKAHAAVGVVIADDMECHRVSLLELLDDGAVLLLCLGEVSQLKDGIGPIGRHRLEKGIEPGGGIMHHIVVKIGDQADSHRFGQTPGGSACRQRQGERTGGGSHHLDESTPRKQRARPLRDAEWIFQIGSQQLEIARPQVSRGKRW